MKNAVFFIISFLVCFEAIANQTDDYRDEINCAIVLEDLVKAELTKNKSALVPFGYKHLVRKEIQSLKLQTVKDLDPGAFNVRRVVHFEISLNLHNKDSKQSAILVAQTRGNFFCDNEVFESIQALLF